MTVWIVALLAALGSATGFLAGLLGIGGGMILTPFLAMLLPLAGVPAELALHCAIATSMSTILFTSLSSVRAHAQRGAVLWKAALALAPGIVLGGIVGARISSALPVFWVALFFSLFVGTCALRMLRAPFLTRCGAEMHQAVGTSAALGFPIALAGTAGYVASGWAHPALSGFPMMLGFIHLPALAAVAAASILTAPLGAKAAHRLDTKPLRRIFALMLFLIAANMLRNAFEAL